MQCGWGCVGFSVFGAGQIVIMGKQIIVAWRGRLGADIGWGSTLLLLDLGSSSSGKACWWRKNSNLAGSCFVAGASSWGVRDVRIGLDCS